jgi:SAM-dependent methyltransferase
MQYRLLKEGFGHSDPLDLPLDISSMGELNILDIATGTGAWILDVARIPEISTRLSPTVANRVTLSACDITDAKFPPKPTRDRLGIKFFLQDVTQPFPPEMHGQFDLVHASLLCFALTEQGWHSALKNIYDILSKPTQRTCAFP